LTRTRFAASEKADFPGFDPTKETAKAYGVLRLSASRAAKRSSSAPTDNSRCRSQSEPETAAEDIAQNSARSEYPR
jgi:hypothetical protein